MAALASSTLQAAPQQKEIRTAFVGIGKRGTTLTGQVLKQANVRVEAICDIDPNARDAALSLTRRDNPRSFTDYRQVLDLQNVDAVIVATPCYLHSEIAVACLNAGKYVYCEKPLGITPEQVHNALQAAARSKVFLQIGQQLRYVQPLRETIRKIHEDKIIGEPFVIKAQRHSTPIQPAAETGAAGMVQRRKALRRPDRRERRSQPGRVQLGRRQPPRQRVRTWEEVFPSAHTAGTLMMDGFSVEYIYENDMHLDYSQLYMHPRALKAMRGGQWYIVFGSKGSLDLTEGTLYNLDSADPVQVMRPEDRGEKENAMSEFYACIRENRKPVADIKVAATAALTAILGREAIYRRRSVTWQELGVTV